MGTNIGTSIGTTMSTSKLKPYPKYKDSGVEWIGEIPEGWGTRKLKYLLRAKVTDGPHETPEFIDYGLPFLSVDSIQDGKLNFENCRHISEKDHKQYWKKCNPEKDDVLIGKAASVGKIAKVKVDFEFSVWSPLALLKPNTKEIDSGYLEYSLKSKSLQDQIILFSNMNTQYNLAMDDIPLLLFVKPSISEQRQIASFLDRVTEGIDTLIQKYEKLIEILKEKRVTLITQGVTKGLNPDVKMKGSGVEWIGEIPEGWEVRRLKYVAGINLNNLGEKTKPDYELSYLDITNVSGTGTILSTEDMIYDMAPSRARRIPEKCDTIISTVRTYLKAIAYLDNISENLIVSTGFAVLHPLREICPKFLFYLARSKAFVEKIMVESKGVGYPAINSSELAALPVWFPEKTEQYQIANYLDRETSKIDDLIAKINNQIELLKEYKTSLISHVVTGKIDVREGLIMAHR